MQDSLSLSHSVFFHLLHFSKWKKACFESEILILVTSTCCAELCVFSMWRNLGWTMVKLTLKLWAFFSMRTQHPATHPKRTNVRLQVAVSSIAPTNVVLTTWQVQGSLLVQVANGAWKWWHTICRDCTQALKHTSAFTSQIHEANILEIP